MSKQADDDDIKRAAEIICGAKRVAILTGAGVSKESGIPTFRDAMTGLWENYNPEELATPEGFLRDPELVWKWYDHRRKMVNDVQPNPGHYAIAKLEALKPLTVITQNVDGLHVKAGSNDVVELHGNILQFICFDRRHPADNIPTDLPAPPKCHCGSLIRPNVVWFGESLPPGALERASDLMSESDVVIVIGTSGMVQPAASLPFLAKRNGGKVIEINPDQTPLGGVADIFLLGPSGKLLPLVVNLVSERQL